MKVIYKKWFLLTLLISSLFLIVLVYILAQKVNTENNFQTSWEDVLFVLDVSKSMETVDISIQNKRYSRLDASKILIQNIVKNFSEKRFGLVVFAEDATSICPITSDHNSFLNLLAWVNWQNVVKQWTNMLNALNLAIPRFQTDEIKEKTMIIISDGGDDEKVKSEKEIKSMLENQKVNILVIWVGTKEGGYIPNWQNIWWDTIYKTENGQNVISKLNKDFLSNVSKTINWDYVTFEDSFAFIRQKLFTKKTIQSEKVFGLNIWSLLNLVSGIWLVFIVLFLGKKFKRFTKRWKR